MKAIRGRFGQYKILEKDPSLSKHLLETKLFSETSFFSFLEKYNCMIIKPLVGPKEVRITVNDEAFELATEIQVLHFTSKEETYKYLIEQVCTRKSYVIQAVPTNLANRHYLFTLHRKSPKAIWKIVHCTSIDKNNIRSKNRFHGWKLNNFLITVAKRLGSAFPECHTVVMDIAKVGARKFWLTDTVLHERNSKWSQYHSLHQKRSLRQFLPTTDLCTKETLFAFLNTYPEVIIKPCVGQQGRGIVKISMTSEVNFEIHEKQSKTDKNDFEELYNYIFEKYLSTKDYIVQQRISLLEINKSPFDARVITQLDEDRWISTGMVVKVAAKNYFVSNRASKLLTLDDALLHTENGMSNENCAKTFEVVCQKAAKRLQKNVRNISIIGFDIGIDRNGAVWIIEGNYAPSLSMFYMFRDNEIHERITYYLVKNKKRD
ncbi:YheC/YheD family protein [Sporosarcina sp. ACRSL]|uniref:YheC/YheD family protein n=1 Tax=Sporosarcina sp. ACRSL TaxID=2918215 RepID=UPI001EF4AEB5|nr:YheC/YheD family protein [Sporosarcina sp. ACRSL]